MSVPETTTPETTMVDENHWELESKTPEAIREDQNHWELESYELGCVVDALIADLAMHPFNCEGGYEDLDRQYAHIIAVGQSIVLLTTAQRTHLRDHM